MIGLPEETPEQFLETIKLNAKVMPEYRSLSVFFPYPATALYDKCIKDNLFPRSMEDEEFFLEREDTTLELPNFPRKNISFYVNNFQNLVRYEYLSNKYKIIDKLFPLNLRNQKKIAWFMR